MINKTYATFKYYEKISRSKFRKVSIFGEQLENGKCKITVLKFNPKDKIFSKKKGWEEYNTGKYASEIISGTYNQDDFIRWCNSWYAKEVVYIMPALKVLKISNTLNMTRHISATCLK